MIPNASAIKLQLMTALNDISFRQKYMLYDRSEEKIDIVMQLLDNKYYVYGDGKLISIKTGIPTSTLSDWRRKKMADVNFNPTWNFYRWRRRGHNRDAEKNSNLEFPSFFYFTCQKTWNFQVFFPRAFLYAVARAKRHKMH